VNYRVQTSKYADYYWSHRHRLYSFGEVLTEERLLKRSWAFEIDNGNWKFTNSPGTSFLRCDTFSGRTCQWRSTVVVLVTQLLNPSCLRRSWRHQICVSLLGCRRASTWPTSSCYLGRVVPAASETLQVTSAVNNEIFSYGHRQWTATLWRLLYVWLHVVTNRRMVKNYSCSYLALELQVYVH